jgi:hypothetical protein
MLSYIVAGLACAAVVACGRPTGDGRPSLGDIHAGFCDGTTEAGKQVARDLLTGGRRVVACPDGVGVE